MAKSTLAYSYLRFSSPEQAKGDSLRRQTALRDAWLAKHHVRLDESVSLRDEGVSGFTGEHRSNPDRHALAAFLELVRAGRIPRGSYLIVESLDRLSREHIRPALTLLLNLIDAGIRVVQLLPSEIVYDEQVEPMTLMIGIMELSRGHSESRVKSERVGSAWREKKRQAAATKVVVTKRVPGWLTVTDGKFELIPDKAAVVRRIFRLAIEGHGLGAITKLLNGEQVPPMGVADYWARSYVAKILANRSVIGEYQPHTGHAGPNRKPDGAPVQNYFPAAVSEEEFYAARAALTARKNKTGRIGKRVNVFQGLLKDARDGGSLHQVDKGKKGVKSLVSYRAAQGLGNAVSFPMEVFEQAVLSRLREIDPRDILPSTSPAEDQVLILSGVLADLEGRIAKIKAKLLEGGDLDVLVDVLRTLDADRRDTAERLAGARQEAASPLSDGWGKLKTLVEVLDNDSRVRLRAALRRVVSEIWCLFLRVGRSRVALVQLYFAGGGSRDYLILHRPAHKGFQGRTPASTEVRSGVFTASEIDLRVKETVAGVERVVRKILTSGTEAKPKPPSPPDRPKRRGRQ